MPEWSEDAGSNPSGRMVREVKNCGRMAREVKSPGELDTTDTHTDARSAKKDVISTKPQKAMGAERTFPREQKKKEIENRESRNCEEKRT